MKTTNEEWLILRDRLANNADVLLTKGSLTAQRVSGRRTWALRFRIREGGRTRHRSIQVGGDLLKARVEAWLSGLRRIVTWQNEIDACVRMARWLSFRLAPRIAPFNWGGKRRRRQNDHGRPERTKSVVETI